MCFVLFDQRPYNRIIYDQTNLINKYSCYCFNVKNYLNHVKQIVTTKNNILTSIFISYIANKLYNLHQFLVN